MLDFRRILLRIARERPIHVLVAVATVSVLIGIAVAASFIDLNTSVSVSTTGPLELYTDYSCAVPLTSFSFGTLVRGTKASAPLWYLKNTGVVRIDNYNWTSNVVSQSGGKITDSFFPSPYSIEPGACQTVYPPYAARYQITIAADAPLQSYAWTLSINTG